MTGDLARLTDREKAVLRLLARGHDAKSAARALGLSIHTVNERLRDARRTLGATSSREAARKLAEAEMAQENRAEKIGVDPVAAPGANVARRSRLGRARRRTVLLLTGATFMLIIAAALLLYLQTSSPDVGEQAVSASPAAAPIYLLSFDIASPGMPSVQPRLTVRAGEMVALARAGMGRPNFEISVVATPDPQQTGHIVLAMNIVSPTDRSMRTQRRVSLRVGEQARVELRGDNGAAPVLTLLVSAQPVTG